MKAAFRDEKAVRCIRGAVFDVILDLRPKEKVSSGMDQNLNVAFYDWVKC